MEQGYLIDTNSVIDYLDNKLPENSNELIDNIEIQTSVIVRMELFSWHEASAHQTQVLEEFIENALVFGLEETIILKAIDIRKNYRLKLPDAIIAATALVKQLILITRNISDFKNIPTLQITNPWSL
jgi:predicted nucleic acid-binding protein